MLGVRRVRKHVWSNNRRRTLSALFLPRFNRFLLISNSMNFGADPHGSVFVYSVLDGGLGTRI